MSSLIQGYNYDIFISYRQKDNKHDGWVTEFVENLKGELESTFKEEISVYFDVNPNDGLLETHDVDDSLKDKLKCLIFIPIISRTYCDPKSFAWTHEFKAFVNLASVDRFGLKVKLPNGNVANRVLPIQIHELENEDITHCEAVLGSVLRGIEFIYREAGVDKPLAPDDDEKRNLNNTKYRIQIVKVTHAIKEIVTSLEHYRPGSEEELREVNITPQDPQKKKRISIITGSAIAVILIILGILFVPKLLKPPGEIEKSIAVLPFHNDSPDQSNSAFVNGLMEKVLNNLQQIKDFRVISRTSVEQYRNQSKSAPVIAKELGVNYIVEGSGQRYGDAFSISIQLIKADKKEDHLWGKSFEQEIIKVEDILKIQTEIAEAIAKELEANITPEEREIIERVPTKSLTAYDFYQRGREEEGKFSYFDVIASSTSTSFKDPATEESLKRAEKMFQTAIEYDSTFALAYTGLAGINWSRSYYREYFSGNFLDSVLLLTNKALSFDDKLPDAHYLMGMYYYERGMYDEADEEFNNTLTFNPNYWLAYYGKGEINWEKCNHVEAIKNFIEAESFHNGSGLIEIYKRINLAYLFSGFKELAESYNRKALELENDSISYLVHSSFIEVFNGNPEKAIETIKRAYLMDSTQNATIEYMAFYNEIIGDLTESSKYTFKHIERLRALGTIRINEEHRLGYLYSKIGKQDLAKYCFNKQIENCESSIRLRRIYGVCSAYYDLAGTYAFLGDRTKAYKNLRIFNTRVGGSLLWVWYIKYDPLFNKIRNEPEFQQIVRDVETKYQAEHERVRKWLEENNML